MKFALPFLFAAVALASLTWFITNCNPVELPPGVKVKEKTTPLLTAK